MSPEDDRRGREARKERAKCHKLPAEMHTDGQCRVAFSAGPSEMCEVLGLLLRQGACQPCTSNESNVAKDGAWN